MSEGAFQHGGFSIEREIAKETERYFKGDAMLKPAYNCWTIIKVTLTVSGVESEHEATVRYHHLPAERGYREPGGGQIDPDYPESIELQAVTIDKTDITHLITDAMEQAIAHEILGE